MTRLVPRLLLVAVLLSTTACEEEMISLAEGEESTLTVRAYVDADGDGALSVDAGDIALQGATVTLNGDGGQLTETVGADGVATITGLLPGSYQASISADVPAGAVLATAESPVVVAPFRSAGLEAEFRYSFFPGEVSGRIFRDDNENGTFDADADLPAVGITVNITAEGESEPLSTTSTDTEGQFSFAGLRPGDYTVEVEPLETMEIVGDPVFQVTVEPDVAESLSILFTGNLLISVAQARDAPEGQTVTVQGTITWAPEFDDRVLFFQDETGGMSVFDFNLPEGLEIGTQIEITGTRGAFDGEIQISPVTVFEVLGTGPVPVPEPVTAARIDGDEVSGELVTLDGTVEQVDVLSFDNQMVLLTDADGETFAVKVDSRTGIFPDTWEVGEVFGVTGVVGTDVDESSTDIEDDHPNRVEVRFPDDVQRGGSSTPIADVRDNLGATVVVQGIVTWQAQWDNRIYFFQDGTAGISVFDFAGPELEMGDLIRVRGEVSEFGGETQISPVDDLEVLDNVAVPAPMGVTATEINDGLFQGELVTVTGTVQSIELNSFGSQTVTLTDGAGDEFVAFSDNRNGSSEDDWTEGAATRVTGVLGTDDDEPFPHRLEVRMPEDIVEVEAGVTSVAEARAMDGEVVTIRAVVTRIPGWDDRIAFLQDETAGLSVFSFDLPELAEGDQVLMTGEIGAFNGEVQIGPDDEADVVVEDQVPVPEPLPVTGAQINAGLFQGQLVAAGGTVVSVEVINDFGTQEVTVQDEAGESFLVFVDNRSGLLEEDWTEGETVEMVGVLGFFDDDDDDEPGVAQLEIIRADDVTFGS